MSFGQSRAITTRNTSAGDKNREWKPCFFLVGDIERTQNLSHRLNRAP